MGQYVRNDSAIIGTTSVQVFPERKQIGQRRVGFSIVNSGSTIVTISKGIAPAISLKGIPLSAGQVYSESNSSDFQCWQGPIQFVSDSAGGLIAITEIIEDNSNMDVYGY